MPLNNASRAMGAERFAPGVSHHIFLIAIRGESEAPVRHRGHPLHPMQVLLTGSRAAPQFADPHAAIGPLPALPAPRRLAASADSPALMPREVTGEILRDSEGRLYEKSGDYVRPVNQLVMGSRGEVIDLVPVRDVSAEASDTRSRQQQRTVFREPGDAAAGDSGFKDDDCEGEVAATPKASFRDIARRLIPEPGLWRLVRYADFIDAITPQLEDPRRLQLGHQLACYVQVYEIASTLTIAALEASAARELGKAGRLLPLSYDLCRRFALSLPRPSFALAARHARTPGIVAAGARFIALRVALDPTADATQVEAISPAAPAATAASPAVVGAARSEGRSPAPVAATSAPKSSIPEEFMKPWELRLSRDEAIYEMTLEASRNGWQRIIARLKNRISGRDMKRWHALLLGKTADQQLWEVKPPKGALADARIRGWAEQTLRLAGYDSGKTLLEWEIYWRRKSP